MLTKPLVDVSRIEPDKPTNLVERDATLRDEAANKALGRAEPFRETGDVEQRSLPTSARTSPVVIVDCVHRKPPGERGRHLWKASRPHLPLRPGSAASADVATGPIMKGSTPAGSSRNRLDRSMKRSGRHAFATRTSFRRCS